MYICIGSVAAIDVEAFSGAEGEKHTLDGLFNAGGVGGCEFVKNGGRTGGAVTTVAGTTSAVAFDVILPMGTEDDGLRWTCGGGTKHLEIVKLIELFAFTLTPEVPSVKVAEFTTSKVSKSLFSGSGGLGADGVDGEGQVVVIDVSGREIEFRMANGGDGTDVGQGKGRNMIWVVGGTVRFKEIKFCVGLASLRCI